MADPFLTVSRIEGGKAEIQCRLEFDDPFAFGMLFVDAARTIALAYADEENASSPAEYLARLRAGFDAEWEKLTTDIQFRKVPPSEDNG